MKRKYKVSPRIKPYDVEVEEVGDRQVVTLIIGDNSFSFEPKKKAIAKVMASNLDKSLERMLHEYEIRVFNHKRMVSKVLPMAD